uniref:Rod_C domain-containing protein n=1 Tax=Steinernema glaseri TaxID=37863 RepID=A0A1I7ZKL6_9BILA
MSCSLSPDEAQKIYELVYSTKEKAKHIVTKCLMTVSDKLSLSELNLDVLRIGASVLKDYQKLRPDYQKLRPDKDVCEVLINRLDSRIRVYSTKYILNEKKLLDQTTEELVNERKSRELITYIYAHLVDWNNADDIKFKTDVAMRVAEVNKLDIHEIHLGIIRKWLEEEEKPQSFADPNATLEDITPTVETLSDNVLAPLPYNEVSTTRIVYLMRLCLDSDKRDDILAFIRQMVKMSPSRIPGGYSTLIQLMCCAYRCLKGEEEFTTVYGSDMTHEQITEQLVVLFYKRLLSISCPDALDAFKQLDKTVFVRDLVSTVTRQKNDLPHLLGCVIADHEIKDPTLIFTVAQRLMNKPKSLFNLLKYCKTVEGLAARGKSTSLVMYWIGVFKALFNEKRESANHGEVRGLLCFLLSCPVELGPVVSSLYLGQHNFYAAEVLSSIAANPTCQVDGSKLSAPRNEKDLSLNWMA